MVTHNILLNVKQEGPLDSGIEVTQGDYGQVQFLMRVKDDETYIMDATAAQIAFSIPNGYIVEGDVSINGGTYNYIFSGNELQSAGKVAAVLTLTLPGGRVSSCGFTFNCRYNPLFDRTIDAGSYISSLEAIKQRAQEQVDYLESLITMLQGSMGETALTRADLVNNALTTQAGIAALDAAMGKTLADKDAELEAAIRSVNSNLTNGLNKKTQLDDFITRKVPIVSENTMFAAGETKEIYINSSYDGYTRIGVAGYNLASYDFIIGSIVDSSIAVKNNSETEKVLNKTSYVSVLYVKDR